MANNALDLTAAQDRLLIRIAALAFMMGIASGWQPESWLLLLPLVPLVTTLCVLAFCTWIKNAIVQSQCSAPMWSVYYVAAVMAWIIGMVGCLAFRLAIYMVSP